MAAILLTGDVMIGRGIDQILRHPSSPELYEPFVASALTYVALAEGRNGRIRRRVRDDYVWGAALRAMRAADLTIVNLETAITRSDKPTAKDIHYRCHPANTVCLTAAGIDCCVLANNHVLDWGEAGLIETLHSLSAAGLPFAGAGRNLSQAEAPAVLQLPGSGRVLVYALGSAAGGIPPSWAAGPERSGCVPTPWKEPAGRPGVNFLANHELAFERLRRRIAADRQARDIVIVSIHWGPNWGYDVDEADRRFARKLLDQAQVDIVHGHSSHHPKSIELHRGKPILYGCGDFLNDYEGISGHERYRPDLVLGYLLTLGPDGSLKSLQLLPFRIARFRLNRASQGEAEWLAATLDRESEPFGTRVTHTDGILYISAKAKRA